MNNPTFPFQCTISGMTELDYFAGIAFGKLIEASVASNSRLAGLNKEGVVETAFDYAIAFLKYREGLKDYLAKGGVL